MRHEYQLGKGPKLSAISNQLARIQAKRYLSWKI